MTNTAGVPVIDSFAQAKARYECTKPIRGHEDKVRPLGNNRRHYHMASIEMPDADTVVFKYCGKPFVTWRSDDSFTVSGDVYHTPWTAEHLKFFLPKRWATGWNNVRMTIGNKGKHYLLSKDDVFRFVKAGDDYEIVNPPISFAVRKKRGVDKKILANAQPFLDWLTVVSAVSGTASREEGDYATEMLGIEVGVKGNDYYRRLLKKIDHSSDDSAALREHIYAEYRYCDSIPVSGRNTYTQHRLYHTPSCKTFLEWVMGDTADKWVLAMHLIAMRQGARRWSQTETFNLSAEQAATYINDVICHVYRDEIFVKEQLEGGVVPSKRNTCYWNEIQFTL